VLNKEQTIGSKPGAPPGADMQHGFAGGVSVPPAAKALSTFFVFYNIGRTDTPRTGLGRISALECAPDGLRTYLRQMDAYLR